MHAELMSSVQEQLCKTRMAQALTTFHSFHLHWERGIFLKPGLSGEKDKWVGASGGQLRPQCSICFYFNTFTRTTQITENLKEMFAIYNV